MMFCRKLNEKSHTTACSRFHWGKDLQGDADRRGSVEILLKLMVLSRGDNYRG